ncbi:family 1 glycosylhydrolase, partial [Bacillus pumilus]|uniref:family 1 glycosylhydrolase n=1 Tax=Bacillus pumilus TaxID=1408 RepID=UPI0034D954EE
MSTSHFPPYKHPYQKPKLNNFTFHLTSPQLKTYNQQPHQFHFPKTPPIDFYHPYEHHIPLFPHIPFKVFRFSISSPTIFPTPLQHNPNQQPFPFYHQLFHQSPKYPIQP